MTAASRIEINPKIMLGKPVIRGTRIPVELLLRKMSEGASEADLLDAYPGLAADDLKAALAYAADTLAHEETVFVDTPRSRASPLLRRREAGFMGRSELAREPVLANTPEMADTLGDGREAMPRFHGKDLRKGRVSEPGRAYLLNTVTRGRCPVFRDWRLGRLVVRELRRAAEAGWVMSLAWVVMPDHLHWLVELEDIALDELMRTVKSRSARAMNAALAAASGSPNPFAGKPAPTAERVGEGIVGASLLANRGCGSGRAVLPASVPLWQKGYHHHALRREEDLRAFARYVVANPLRAGLVGNLGVYPLWDAIWV